MTPQQPMRRSRCSFSQFSRCFLLLYTMHLTLYTIHYTLYTIHYTPYNKQYTLYTIHYIHCPFVPLSICSFVPLSLCPLVLLSSPSSKYLVFLAKELRALTQLVNFFFLEVHPFKRLHLKSALHRICLFL